MNTSLTLQDFQYYRDLSNDTDIKKPSEYFKNNILELLEERCYTDEQIKEIRSFFRDDPEE
jgi:hypothetical protein